MRLTNKLNYPNQVVKAAESTLVKPEPNIYRITELIDAPLIRYYLLNRWNEIIIDVDDLLQSMFGTAWHKYVSSFENGSMLEKRWTIRIDKNGKTFTKNGIIITGQTDIYRPNKGIIEDNKVTSVWAFVFGKPEWEQQLNLYAYLVEKEGYKVNSLWINAYLKDWSKYEAERDWQHSYPPHRFFRIKVPLWPIEKRKEFLIERIKDHLYNPQRPCNSQERWQKTTTFAIMKKGQKRAMRVLDSLEEAEQYILQKDLTKDFKSGKIGIIKRLGQCVRCDDYCIVRNVCQYKEK